MLSVYLFGFFFILISSVAGLFFVEKRRGVRFLAKRREAFDEWVVKTEQDIRTLKPNEFIEHSIKFILFHISHEILGLLHIIARYVELLLRRLRRKLQRARPKQEEPSGYVQTMKEFKNGLNTKE